MPRKSIIGKIISTKLDQTATVLVERIKSHPKYKKQYRISKKYLVQNPDNKFKLDQIVKIQETKPISKSKKFIITSIAKEIIWFN